METTIIGNCTIDFSDGTIFVEKITEEGYVLFGFTYFPNLWIKDFRQSVVDAAQAFLNQTGEGKTVTNALSQPAKYFINEEETEIRFDDLPEEIDPNSIKHHFWATNKGSTAPASYFFYKAVQVTAKDYATVIFYNGIILSSKK